MSRTLSASVKVDARFNVVLHNVPDNATTDDIKRLAEEQLSMYLQAHDPLRHVDYWEEDVVSIQTQDGTLIYEK